MAPDPRLQESLQFTLVRTAALAHWQVVPPTDRLAWAAQSSAARLGGLPQDLQIDWRELRAAELELGQAVRDGDAWDALCPEGWEARGRFFDALGGLAAPEQATLAAAAQRWLDTTPHGQWLRQPASGTGPAEFTALAPPPPRDRIGLWGQLQMFRADLAPRAGDALNVLLQLDRDAWIGVVETLPAPLLWVVTEGQLDFDLSLRLARSGHVLAASCGAYRFFNDLIKLEQYGERPAQSLDFFRSIPSEVGRALTRRATVRGELRERAAALVTGLGGGTRRPELLTDLIKQATGQPELWTGNFVAFAAAEALAGCLSATPELAEKIRGAFAANDRMGPLDVVPLILSLPKDARPAWREMTTEHLIRRIALPVDDKHDLGPLSLSSEPATLMYAGLLLADWLVEDEEAATSWFTHCFALVPVRATRGEHRSWLFGSRAAFLCVLGAEALSRAAHAQPAHSGTGSFSALRALLAQELEVRTPEWEWTNSMGVRPLNEWPGLAICTCSPLLTAQERRRIAAASRSAWTLAQLLDTDEMEPFEDELAERLAVDLPEASLDVIQSLERRLALLRQWPALTACRPWHERLSGPGSLHTGNRYGAVLNALAQSAGDVEALLWWPSVLRRSHSQDAFHAYSLLVSLLRDLTGELEWRHAVADVDDWITLVLERPVPGWAHHPPAP